MENTCNYSDEWQPYIGDYDKFEYDIKLKDGRIVKNCYPNARKFNSISDEYDGESFDEEEIDEIRFSHKLRYGITIPDNSSGVIDEEYYNTFDDLFNPTEDKYLITNPYTDLWNEHLRYEKPIQYIREEPKIHRNDPCPCGSGKKYKKCCIDKVIELPSWVIQ